MKALIQRVSRASVNINNKINGEIEQGLLIFLGIDQHDNEAIADKLLNKILGYRVFVDSHKKMNLNVQQINGELLVISQFTLSADTHKGLRPSFSSAAPPEQAQPLYDHCISRLQSLHTNKVAYGIFGADMQVSLTNDGPVTFLLEVSL